MKKIILLLVFIFPQLGLNGYLFAQKITLNEAMQKGIENRIELKTQVLTIQIANSENKKIKQNGFRR